MRNTLILPILLSFACNSSPDEKQAPAPFSVGSVAPPQFRNSAQSGSEVATRLDAMAGALRLTAETPSNNWTTPDLVAATETANRIILDGIPDDCSSLVDNIHASYDALLVGMRSFAAALRELEAQPLPAGFTRHPATATMATAYSVDLAHADLPWPDPSGTAAFGVGASDEEIAAELRVDAAVSGATLVGASAAYADQKARTARLKANFDLSANDAAVRSKLKGDVALNLVAGTPLALTAAANLSGTIVRDGKTESQSTMLTVTLQGETLTVTSRVNGISTARTFDVCRPRNLTHK